MVDNGKRVKIVEMLESGESPTEIARKLKTSRNTVYRVKKESKEGNLKDLKVNEPKTVGIEEAQVIKLVPNERLVLARIGDRFIRVVKQPTLRPKVRSTIKVMEVKDDLYRLV
jgi:transcriptional regulator